MAETTETTAEDKPVARLVDNPAREAWVDLDWPVQYGDEIIARIRVRRVSGKEVQDYFNGMGKDENFIIPPVIDCAMDIWNVLDAEDQEKIEVRAQDFFPPRLRRVAELILANGEALSASSATPSIGPQPTSPEKTG